MTTDNTTKPDDDAIKSNDEAKSIHNLNLIGETPPASSQFEAPPVDTAEKRGRGRPKGAAKKKEAPEGGAKVEAETIVYLNDAALLALCGESLSPADDLRRAYIAEIQVYMESSGNTLPPWVKLVAIAGAYNARAFYTPTFRQRAGFAWGKVKGWFKR